MGFPSASATASAPLKVSPAAVASTASTFTPGKCRPPVPSSRKAPFSPSLRITARGPRRRSAFATWGASASVTDSPRRSSKIIASVSLGVRQSTLARRASARGRDGAGSSTTVIPCDRPSAAAAFTVSTGDSSCSRSRPPSAVCSARATSLGASRPLAPEATTIWFCPPACTKMSATPDGVSSVASTSAVSTPAAARLIRSCPPNTSFPTRPTMRTRPPSFPDPHAWFAPLPPGMVLKPRPRTVCPGSGSSSTCTTKSMFRLPTTVIGALMAVPQATRA